MRILFLCLILFLTSCSLVNRIETQQDPETKATKFRSLRIARIENWSIGIKTKIDIENQSIEELIVNIERKF